jgi:hypothetical protein
MHIAIDTLSVCGVLVSGVLIIAAMVLHWALVLHYQKEWWK